MADKKESGNEKMVVPKSIDSAPPMDDEQTPPTGPRAGHAGPFAP